MDDFDKFFRTRKVPYSMLRYILGLAKVGHQGQLLSKETKRKYVIVIQGNKADRRAHYTNAANAANRTDENLTDRIPKFQTHLKSEYDYGIPLKFLCDLGLVNQHFKFNTKYILRLETEMQRLFETNFNQNADALPRTVDADIVFTEHHTSCTNNFNWTTILKSISREQFSPSMCLEWELNQHPIRARKRY